jgi:thiol-disulfide isomerase/thioredoxin
VDKTCVCRVFLWVVVVFFVASSSEAEEPSTPREDTRAETERAGIGVNLARRDGQLLVGKVFPGTPAARSGKIHEGDRLIAVGQGNQQSVDVKAMPIEKVVPMIRGAKGSVVILTIIPAGKADTDAIVVPLTRAATKELNRFGDGNYIALGAMAPNFNAVELATGDKYELKNSLGKIVVLEFWARWCGPCLKAVDHLQKCREQHPEWKDRVKLIAVAVDDEKKDAAECFQQNGQGWKHIDAVWTGPNSFKAFHISGLPTIYVLDEGGRVIAAGGMDIPSVIKKALSNVRPRRSTKSSNEF